MYQETLQFYHLWRLAVQERDEAREHLQRSLTELSLLHQHFNTSFLSEEQQIPHYNSEATTDHKKYSYNNFSDDSLSQFSSDLVSNSTVYSSPEICNSDCYNIRKNENKKDFETLVLEIIGPGRVLPENGKFEQAVIEAGSLVGSLFITGPIPKWRNPPVQMLSQKPVIGKWNYGGLELGPGILNRSVSGNTPRFSLMP